MEAVRKQQPGPKQLYILPARLLYVNPRSLFPSLAAGHATAVPGYPGRGRGRPFLVHVRLASGPAHGECTRGLRALHGDLVAQRLVLQGPAGRRGLLALRR